MFGDFGLQLIGFISVAAFIAVFRIKSQRHVNRQVDLNTDYVLRYEISVWPKLLSLLGALLFLGGALTAAFSTPRWIGSIVALIGMVCLGYCFIAQRIYIFKPGHIVCFRGKSELGTLSFSEVTGLVRIDHSANISLLGVATESEPHGCMPRPGFFSNSLFNEHPKVSIVFSSERGGVHADILLRELQARLPDGHGIDVHREHHSMDIASVL